MGGGLSGTRTENKRGDAKSLHIHIHSPIRSPNLSVAERLWNICLLGRAIAGLSYERFIANRQKFKLPTYIQEPLVTGRRGYLQRDLNEKTVSNR
jgi:hypothetical protein